ncbi:hypothetical protein BLS_007023 [Venturia inaequalis]|uniref:Amidohydrolase 3 domain-containing protein n=1 Tax=Venturia inaequalis TaxID=5025 RepID=A0A8H3VI05_VENIN|nr:hypothetical protein BLS_007023 [Venturia inaequalis]KAE9989474.1 hypothetical protein EG327_002666 [Venturia inaequalis]RDI87228.1 hypothetical protein Vi05172_g2957 [Venturia inaequalis]
MLSTGGYLSFTAVVALIIALVLAFVPGQSDTTYCYDTVTTLSDQGIKSNCFTVSPTGIFSRVSPDGIDNSSKRKGHVIPGLIDGHGHLLQFGELLQSVNIFGASSLNDAIKRVEEYLEKHPNSGSATEWIRGTGWDQAAFGRMPTAADLESSTNLAGKYIMLDRVDVHCIWVSASVLALLSTPFPEIPGGEIITDPSPGVFCDNAMDIVLEHWPKPTKEKKTQFIKNAMVELNKVGLVGMADAGVPPSDLAIYEELAERSSIDQEGDWTVRVYAMVECAKRNTFCPEQAPWIDRADGMLSVKSVKLFGDGALGSWGSAMLEPYSDRSSTTGSLLVNASTLESLTLQWSQAGYQVNIHAIGDLANRLAINSFTNAYPIICPGIGGEGCQKKRRFRIEHSQIVHPNDQKRMFEVGIIPSIQPTHATSDMSYAEDRLGDKRTADEAYKMRSFLPLHPILGSDFPVEPANPFEGIFAAVTRKSPRTGLGKNGAEHGWHLEEALSLDQALRGFTHGPAHGTFMEGKVGVIQEGAFADWVVLDEPLDGLALDDLRKVKVRETWVSGRCVYRREEQSEPVVKQELK